MSLDWAVHRGTCRELLRPKERRGKPPLDLGKAIGFVLVLSHLVDGDDARAYASLKVMECLEKHRVFRHVRMNLRKVLGLGWTGKE